MIACGGTALERFISDQFATPSTEKEHAVISSCRLLLAASGREQGRLELGDKMYAYLGTRKALSASIGRNARDP